MLKLYDGTSPIEWTTGIMTREEMDDDLHYPPSDQPCVLMENDGVAYDWRYLKVLCEQNNIEFIDGLDNYQELFDKVIYTIEHPVLKPTLGKVNEKVDENTLAIAELGVTTTTNINESGQALGELGILVAELKTSNEELIKQNEELKSQLSDLKLKVENLQVNSALTF